jgi:fucose 4-O-acetylase-like acetyltransferase
MEYPVGNRKFVCENQFVVKRKSMPLTKPRIEYIDVIKGFSILWVVIIHLPPMSLDWLYVGYRMPLFFFISGVFFRMRPFKVFFYRRINTLIVPFVFFYIITFLLTIVKYEVIAPQLSSVDYIGMGEFKEYATNFINLFKVSYDRINSPPMLINGALWFLIALFNIQMVYYALNKIIRNKYFLLSLCLIFHIIGKILSYYEINGLFYLAATSSFLIYYALGNIFISNLNEALNSRKKKYLLLIICLSILIPLSLLNPLSLSNYAGDTIVDKSIKNLLLNIRIVFFFPICFLFFKEIHQIIPLKLFRFF